MIDVVTRCVGGVADVNSRTCAHAGVGSFLAFSKITKRATSPWSNFLCWMLEGSGWPDEERRSVLTSRVRRGGSVIKSLASVHVCVRKQIIRSSSHVFVLTHSVLDEAHAALRFRILDLSMRSASGFCRHHERRGSHTNLLSVRMNLSFCPLAAT